MLLQFLFNNKLKYSPEGPAHGLVVHVGLVFVQAPESGDGLGVDQLEDALLPVGPLDISGTRLLVLQQLEQKFPQVGGGALPGLPLDGDAVGSDLGTVDPAASRGGRRHGPAHNFSLLFELGAGGTAGT